LIYKLFSEWLLISYIYLIEMFVAILRILVLFGLPLIGSIFISPLYVNYMKPDYIKVGWDMLMLYQKVYLECLVGLTVVSFFFMTYPELFLVGLVLYLSYMYAYEAQVRLFVVLETIGVMRYE